MTWKDMQAMLAAFGCNYGEDACRNALVGYNLALMTMHAVEHVAPIEKPPTPVKESRARCLGCSDCAMGGSGSTCKPGNYPAQHEKPPPKYAHLCWECGSSSHSYCDRY